MENTELRPNLPQSQKLKDLGVLPEVVLSEFLSVANQNKDFTNKLKALKPLLREIGIELDLTTAPANNNIIQVHVNEHRQIKTVEYTIVEPLKLPATAKSDD